MPSLGWKRNDASIEDLRRRRQEKLGSGGGGDGESTLGVVVSPDSPVNPVKVSINFNEEAKEEADHELKRRRKARFAQLEAESRLQGNQDKPVLTSKAATKRNDASFDDLRQRRKAKLEGDCSGGTSNTKNGQEERSKH